MSLRSRNRTIVGLKHVEVFEVQGGAWPSQSHHSGIETKLRLSPPGAFGSSRNRTIVGLKLEVGYAVQNGLDKSQSHHSGIETVVNDPVEIPQEQVAIAP